MRVIALLFRTSPFSVFISIAGGLLSGAAMIKALALLNTLLLRHGSLSLVRFGSIALLSLVASSTSQYFLSVLSNRAVLKLRTQLAGRVLQLPLRVLEQLGPGRLMTLLSDEIATVSASLPAVPLLLTNIAIILACFGYMAWLSPTLCGVTLGVLGLGVLGYLVIMGFANKGMSKSRAAKEKLHDHYRALIFGAKELRLHRDRRDDFWKNSVQRSATELRDHTVITESVWLVAQSWAHLMFLLTIGFVLVAGQGYFHLGDAVLAGYATSLMFLMAPLQGMGSGIPAMMRTISGLEEIESVGSKLTETEPSESMTLEPKKEWNSIRLDAVTQEYHHEREKRSFKLGPIDLTIERGQIIFIIGGNGSGKSTLAKVLAGLYPPQSGQIFIDDQRIGDANRDWYRQQFSAVFADFYLFPELSGLKVDALDARANQLLKLLQLDHKVTIENGTFSTTNLSTGQRKRLALLVAYLEDRSLYVFDEWAADQDPVFKRVFYTELLPDLKKAGKTIIAITHDDSYFFIADEIIKLEDGKLREEGTANFVLRMAQKG